MFSKGKEYAFVLSGGGARGAYEIGVWKALREIGVKIAAVAGTSIGAVNGAFVVQDDFETAYEVWQKAAPELFFDMDMGVLERYRDTSRMREVLSEYIDEKKFRDSPLDYCLVTYNLSERMDVVKFKDDIEEGMLVDYILASANYPVFRRQQIDGDYYIDGGVFDNMPGKPLVDKGYKDIIVVDIRDMLARRYRKFETKGVRLITIKSKHPLHGVLDFSNEKILENIAKGYLDTYQKHGRFKSSFYYINHKKSKSQKNITQEDLAFLRNNAVFHDLVSSDSLMIEMLEHVNRFRKSVSLVSVRSSEFFLACVEICAKYLDIPVFSEYGFDEICAMIVEAAKSVLEKSENWNAHARTRILTKIKEKTFTIDEEDKYVMLSALLSAFDNAGMRTLLMRLSPGLAVTYMSSAILLNRAGLL